MLVLLGCGVVETALRRWRGASRLGVHAWLVLAAASDLPELSWTALKVGALSYGGGFVIIPLMQGDAVDTYGWMSQAEFSGAVAFGQLTPGPVTQTVAVVGYAASGLGGALLAAFVAFAPSFLVIALGGRRFEALRANTSARAFLDGAGPAAVGAILGAAVPLAAGIEEPWQVAVAVVAAAALLLRRAPIVVLLGAAAVGVAAALLGAEVPR